MSPDTPSPPSPFVHVARFIVRTAHLRAPALEAMKEATRNRVLADRDPASLWSAVVDLPAGAGPPHGGRQVEILVAPSVTNWCGPDHTRDRRRKTSRRPVGRRDQI
ncbi:hypothetical protein GCM10009772_03350 [Pseudonocardia alni subsp. carboxydivorans]